MCGLRLQRRSRSNSTDILAKTTSTGTLQMAENCDATSAGGLSNLRCFRHGLQLRSPVLAGAAFGSLAYGLAAVERSEEHHVDS